MKNILMSFVFIGFVICTSTSVWGQKSEKQIKIAEFLSLSGSGDIGKQYFDMIMDQFKSLFTDVPEEFWSEAKTMMDSNELVELIIPIYDRHFSIEEIEDLIAFYQTPTGKKLVKTQPIIMEESMLAGQIWGDEFAQRVVEKLKKSGY